ncbi:hypothetical protein QAD02_009662 [Eretmocerus hayati]|uniref:Uncharacterized protein n=1 Tax=Eretmocerus hayati TaxID=131215 RepID=A0ACC2NCE3_9HYME|nr:hypothetical protein QAD02_009662 [Eretmocerus hayati]
MLNNESNSRKSYAQAAQAEVTLTREQAMVLDSIDDIPLREFALAIGKLMNPSHVAFMSRMKLIFLWIIWGLRINALSANTTPHPAQINDPIPGFGELKKYLDGCKRAHSSRTESSSSNSNDDFAVQRPIDIGPIETHYFPCEAGPSWDCNPTTEQIEDQGEHKETENCKNQKKFECNFCSKSFHRRSCLNKHLKSHSDERPMACSICSDRFKNNRNLNDHMLRKHGGERSHSCDCCGKCFAVKQDLKTHMRVHSNDNLFSCELCHRKFRRKSSLRLHIRIHTGEKPYPCEICGKGFTCASVRNKHIEIHTDEKTFGCRFCRRYFKHQSRLNKHVINEHFDESNSLENDMSTITEIHNQGHFPQDSGVYIEVTERYQQGVISQISRVERENIRECVRSNSGVNQGASDGQSVEDFSELNLQETARGSSNRDTASPVITMTMNLLDDSNQNDELS